MLLNEFFITIKTKYLQIINTCAIYKILITKYVIQRWNMSLFRKEAVAHQS